MHTPQHIPTYWKCILVFFSLIIKEKDCAVYIASCSHVFQTWVSKDKAAKSTLAAQVQGLCLTVQEFPTNEGVHPHTGTWGQQMKFWPQRPWQLKRQKGLAETAYSCARNWRTKQQYTGVENRRKEGWDERACKHQVCSKESRPRPCRAEGRGCPTLGQMDTQISQEKHHANKQQAARDLACTWWGRTET